MEPNDIRNSLHFKLFEGKNVFEEATARQSSWYYTYSPYSTTTDKYIKFHLCGKKIRVCKGAPRTRKTTSAIWDQWALMLGEHPVYSDKNVVDKYSEKLGFKIPFIDPKKEIKIWVVAQSYKMVNRSDGLLEKFMAMCPNKKNFNVINMSSTNNYVIRNKFENRSITFISQENPNDAKSSSVHSVFIDERIQSDLMRRDLRLRVLDTNGLLTFSQDSTSVDEWAEELSKSDAGQLFEFELNDNIDYLPKDDVERLKKELSETDKQIYIMGKFKDKNVTKVFPETMFNEFNYEPIEPKRCDFSMGRLITNEKGIIRIFKEPERNQKYILGVDTAKGTGYNAHAGQVINALTGEQCACFINNDINFMELDEILIAPLGYYYNKAIVVVEDKHSGMTVIRKLQLYYPNLYFESRKSDYTVKSFGVQTDETNKIEMINSTKLDLSLGRIKIHCSKTMTQLLGYMEHRDGKISQKGERIIYKGTMIKGDEDLKGSDDDLVVALFMADRAATKWNLLQNASKDIVKEQTIDNLTKNDILYTQKIKKNDGVFNGTLNTFPEW